MSQDKVLTSAQQSALAAISTTLAARLATMGQDPSGLFNYYARKLRHGALLSQCDLHALEILRRYRGRFRRVWEIGSGVGQLTAMMALEGFDVVPIDGDHRRYAAQTEVLDVLQRLDPAARARVNPRFGSFPGALGADDVRHDAVVVLNVAFTGAEADYRAFLERLPRFTFGLIDFARLFTETPNQSEWHQRARDFTERHGVATRSVASYEIPEVGKRGELFLIGEPGDASPMIGNLPEAGSERAG